MLKYRLIKESRGEFEGGLDGVLVAIIICVIFLLLFLPITEIVSAIRFMMGVPEEVCQMGSTQFLGIPAFFIGSRILRRNLPDYLYPIYDYEEESDDVIKIRKEQKSVIRLFRHFTIAVAILIITAILLFEVCPIYTGIVDILFTIITCLCVCGAFIISN